MNGPQYILSMIVPLTVLLFHCFVVARIDVCTCACLCSGFIQVSDVGPVPDQLSEGCVITVEPGVYFMPLMLQRAKADLKQVSVRCSFGSPYILCAYLYLMLCASSLVPAVWTN